MINVYNLYIRAIKRFMVMKSDEHFHAKLQVCEIFIETILANQNFFICKNKWFMGNFFDHFLCLVIKLQRHNLL